MTAMTPDQIAAQWASRLGASGDKMKAGIQATQVAPGQAAARQKAVWQQNTVNAADKWAANVSKVSLQDWQNAMITKGLSRVATGATAAQSKMTDFFSKLIPYQQQQKNNLPARGTYEQNKARASAWMDAMHNFNYKGQ